MIDIYIENAFIHIEKLPLAPAIFHKMESWLLPEQFSYSDKRKNDYLAGRYCATIAAHDCGFKLKQLAMDDARAPVWPKGLKGSISHNKQFAIAVTTTKLKGIGVDIELTMETNRYENIKRMIVSEKEEELVLSNNQLLLLPTLIFSAKESLYKAIYPLCDEYFGFLEATFTNFNKDAFTIELHSINPKVSPFNGKYSGHYTTIKESILTWIALE